MAAQRLLKLLTVDNSHLYVYPPFRFTADAGFLTLPRSAPTNARRASAIKSARVRNIAAQVLRSRSAAGKVQPNIDHRDICAGRHGAALQTRHPR